MDFKGGLIHRLYKKQREYILDILFSCLFIAGMVDSQKKEDITQYRSCIYVPDICFDRAGKIEFRECRI